MTRFASTLTLDLQDFRSLSPQLKFFLSIQILILFCLSVLVGVIFSPKFTSQVSLRSGVPLETVPTEAPKSQNTLTLSTEKQALRVGETQTVSVTYDGDSPEVIDSAITYDPKVFRVEKIKNGELFDTVLQSRQLDGRVIFSSALSLEKIRRLQTVRIKGLYFSFTITALQSVKSTELAFVPSETFVWSRKQNILTDTRGTLIDITRSYEPER
ncbi:hypothetical protein A3I56_00140 [Candidatus Roizmanbacteria bacterium RIFCSPLOWO2_02_FULL_43_10]|uniref:Cohesin domain-containing protein n=2 Tax=Candidatus Roizmaniibacteriota TaxID=1752723 RepID=A0A1F7JUA4_9BACT|nr:MAG: hypothetical protein A3D08_00700 [Candidatus Roizmanbacteria bacterium RIFCSPHIGHO2_02_FULL_43_11]OGK59188.1 MAG: hypothetical protein A3I56_00140 [Candidatus Roizmanbacteria bacterium RIFCSPLOWO2_02_FULL_43_10]